jgi:hypothetical protein
VKNLHLSLIFPAMLLVSCASDSKKEKSSPAEATKHKSLEERFQSGGGRDPNGFQQDSDGKLTIKNAKRSPFEAKGESNMASKSFDKKAYKSGDFSKKSFWGNKEYDRKAYTGNTDGSEFQKSSKIAEKGARESSTTAKIPEKYDTNAYATDAAREAGNAPIQKGTNDQFENKRDDFERPAIIDYREQRQMSKAQATSILGR